jgi:hypothetical protein
MSKFNFLADYLKNNKNDELVLSFEEIEKINGEKLCATAYHNKAYWYCSQTHTLANMIDGCGYDISADLKNKRLLLTKKADGIIQKNNKNADKKNSKRPSSKRKANLVDVPRPNTEEVRHWLEVWDSLEDYTIQEEAINELFMGKYNSNNDIKNIIVKCSILNDFYSTNIYKVYPVASHILSLNIDDKLNRGDLSVVQEIATNKISDKDKNFYSFASKYCSHHNPDAYPIYDYYVDRMLRHFRDADGFYKFDNDDLKDYVKFKNILLKFREYYCLQEFTIKELDKYLWQVGKKYYPKKYKTKTKQK